MRFRLLPPPRLDHFINDLTEFSLFQQDDLSTGLSKSLELLV